MTGRRLRAARQKAGWSQTELADRAGVSRQLVGAIESGRHRPGVDAALAIASALASSVETLFAPVSDTVDVVTGLPPGEGTLVRAAVVGDRPVSSPAGLGGRGWDVADGLVEDGQVSFFREGADGWVVVGCEPGLEVLEGLMRQSGIMSVSVMASSAVAIDALANGRAHAAVVHGPEGGLPELPGSVSVARFGLAQWRVGVASSEDLDAGWAERVRNGASVIQREGGAAVQRVLELAVGRDKLEGPVVTTHLEAARLATDLGLPAVTIEPAALAVGAAFLPLEHHLAELWVSLEHLGNAATGRALELINGSSFQRRLSSIGGYDLTRCGIPSAA